MYGQTSFLDGCPWRIVPSRCGRSAGSTHGGFAVSTKTSQLQIRISPSQKEMLKRMADQAGLSLSAYVLSRALPSVRRELETKLPSLP